MVEVLDDKKVLSRISAYFDMLKQTGYVKDKMTFRLLLYIFLYDFVEELYDYFTEEDYNKLNALLLRLFADGGCLLPYETFGNCRVKIGSKRYEGVMVRRESEEGDNRITEDEHQRAI